MSKRDEPGSDRLTGSLRDRMNASRHDFTLDVFTRKGEFWNAIDQLRTRWRVAPRGEIPEFSSAYHCPNSVIAFHVPTEWPAALAPSPLLGSRPPFWELVNVLPPDSVAESCTNASRSNGAGRLLGLEPPPEWPILWHRSARSRVEYQACSAL